MNWLHHLFAPPEHRMDAFYRALIISLTGWGMIAIGLYQLAAPFVLVAFLIMLGERLAVPLVWLSAALLSQANVRLWGLGVDDPWLSAVPWLGAVMVTLWSAFAARWPFSRSMMVVIAIMVCGTVLAVATSRSTEASLLAIATWAAPLLCLLWWYQSLPVDHQAGRQAAYAGLGVLTSLVLVSWAIFFLGGGHDHNGKDFNGAVWHPQVLGLTMVLVFPLVWSARRMPAWMRLAIVLMALTLIWVAWSRTGLAATVGFAMIAGAGLFLKLLRRKDVRQRPKRRANRAGFQRGMLVAGLLAGLLCASIAVGTQMSKVSPPPSAEQKIFSLEAYASTRAGVVSRTLQRFVGQPVFGTGFGVPSDERLLAQPFAREARTILVTEGKFLAVPDQGNSYLALLEENGLIGAILWMGLVGLMLTRASIASSMAWHTTIIMAVCWFAEDTVTQASGIGLAQWAILAMAAAWGKATDGDEALRHSALFRQVPKAGHPARPAP